VFFYVDRIDEIQYLSCIPPENIDQIIGTNLTYQRNIMKTRTINEEIQINEKKQDLYDAKVVIRENKLCKENVTTEEKGKKVRIRSNVFVH